MSHPPSPRAVHGPLLLLLAATLSVLLASCNSMPSQPKALNQVYDAYEQNRVAWYKAAVAGTNGGLTAATKAGRNDIINDFILMIDRRYDHVEKHMYDAKAWTDFGGSVLSTGLGTAATLSGTNGVKTTLSALVTAIDSTKVSFSKDVLAGQSMLAITAQMRKLRSEKLLEIRRAMRNSPEDYPLSEALIDLMAYFNAGTFVVALESLTEDAAAAKKVADQHLANLRGSYGPDNSSALLRAYWKPGGVVDATRTKALNDWLASKAPGVDVATLLYNADYASLRADAVVDFKLK